LTYTGGEIRKAIRQKKKGGVDCGLDAKERTALIAAKPCLQKATGSQAWDLSTLPCDAGKGTTHEREHWQ